MRKLYLLLMGVLLFSGCCGAETFARVEYAYGVPFGLAKVRNDTKTGYRSNGEPEGGLPMNGHYGAIKVGIRTEIAENVDLGIAAGPAIFAPTKGPSEEFFSLEANPRLTYTGWAIRPYAEIVAGIGFSDRHRWEYEGTQRLFSIGGGAGVTIPLDEKEKWELDVGYRFYHVSNGTKVFGAKEPNVGYNTDLLMLGIQYNF